MNMANKVAIVTGGARGIGSATARLLALRGAAVVINYVSQREAAEAVAEEIRAAGGRAAAFRADVRDEQQIAELVRFAKETFGGRIDILVNNANMSFAMKPFEAMSWEEFSQKLNDELKSAFMMTKAVIPSMIEHKYGRIVYISSGLGKHPGPNMIAHGTAKGGLDTFSLYIAQEFGPHGITANVVAPGLVDTDATAFIPDEMKKAAGSHAPLGRVGQPDDIAGVVAFLASDDAKFVTGTYTPVNGGASME
ncbi:SDR family NAD(P)-dependent oxidoreductase [Paenibacillus humicola]|uniref:SDR family NAD(P)-dependent oxidoreductase n=1 Tax=Paenibacillus humicola TaxID=3110540 RepID=UPI00237B7C8C|nr:SDR family oxidoreductase [Paenibacillus humicola]